MYNFPVKKVVIILDNLPCQLSEYFKEIALKTSMRFLYNLTKNSRSNPIEYFFGYLKPLLEDMPYKRFDDYA